MYQGRTDSVPRFVNNKTVSVLRDTGCTTFGVKRKFIHHSQLTGIIISCMTFGGTIEEYPAAMIDVKKNIFFLDEPKPAY